MLLDSDSDRIQTATLYALMHILSNIQYERQLKLISIMKFAVIIE